MQSEFHSIVASFAADVHAGRVDLLEVLELAAEELEAETSLTLCPTCGAFPVRPSTRASKKGLCVRCHMRRLADAHREALACLEAQQELNAAKQQRKRMREALGIEAGSPEAKRLEHAYGARQFPATAQRYIPVGCATCGKLYAPHALAGDPPVCLRCEDAAERRAAHRVASRDAPSTIEGKPISDVLAQEPETADEPPEGPVARGTSAECRPGQEPEDASHHPETNHAS